MKRENYQRAKEWLLRPKVQEDATTCLQNYTVLFTDSKVEHQGSHACYRTIMGTNRVPRTADCIVSATSKRTRIPVPTMESTGLFYKWLLKDSPFAPVFKRKDVKQSIEEGIICYTTKRFDLTGGALIAARTAYEYPMAVRMWTKMVKGGVNPSLAYMLMMTFREDGKVNVASNYGGGHECLPYTIYTSTVMNFLNNTPAEANVPSFRDYGGYNNTHKMWNNKQGLTVSKYFKDIFGRKYPSRKTLFGGTVPSGATDAQLVKEVLALQKKLIGEVV